MGVQIADAKFAEKQKRAKEQRGPVKQVPPPPLTPIHPPTHPHTRLPTFPCPADCRVRGDREAMESLGLAIRTVIDALTDI